MEKGDDGKGSKGPLAPAPPASRGEFLASARPLDDLVSNSDGLYFFVDGSCTPPLNGDPSVTDLPDLFAADGVSPMSSFALFPADPGARQIAVVDWSSAVTPTCMQLMGSTQQGEQSVTIASGQQVLVFVYGMSLTDMHLLTAPIAP